MAEVENPVESEILTKRKYTPRTDDELIEAANNLKKTSWFGYFFTILREEWLRVTLFAIMFSTISFTYAFLRLFKDRVVYAVLDNTDTKNWLKLLTFIVTQLLVIFCQNISSKTDFNNAFRIMTICFTVFLAINALLMMATRYVPIQLNDIFSDLLFVSDSLTVRGLNGFYPLCIVLNQYVYSAFYILSEVIGSMMVSFCFMTYVNNNTSENQNKRFVRTLLFFSNISSCFAGLIYKFWSDIYKKRPKADSDVYYFIFPFCTIALYIFILFIKRIVEKELLNLIVIPSGAPKKSAPKKKKVGFRDSIYLMVNSKLLLSMCAVAFFYNFSTNLLETANASGMAAAASYFDKEKSFFATGFKSMDLICTSIVTCIIVISPISLLPDKFGIAAFAAVPLTVSFCSSLVEFWFSVTNFPATGSDNMWPFHWYNAVNRYPYEEAVAGTAIQSFMKIAKYAFFDIVKELVAMKIDPSIRPLFKGVFDGSITKLGKSIGSFYGIIMFTITGAQDSRYYFGITALVIVSFCCVWVIPIRYLSKSYSEAKATGTYMDPGLSNPDIKL